MIDISHSCIKVSLPTTYLVREEKNQTVSLLLSVLVIHSPPLHLVDKEKHLWLKESITVTNNNNKNHHHHHGSQ